MSPIRGALARELAKKAGIRVSGKPKTVTEKTIEAEKKRRADELERKWLERGKRDV